MVKVLEIEVNSLIIELADGNPGALGFLMQVITNPTTKGLAALTRMVELGIKGEKLYLIWNDCCDRDQNKTIDVMLKKSYDEILDHIDMQKNMGRGKPFDED